MEKLDIRTQALIEKLYFEVKAYAEGEYNEEGRLDISKKDSTKLIFKDRNKAITMIKEAIVRFSDRHSLDRNVVKNYLLEIIEEDINSNKKFKEEYIEVKKMISLDDEER